MSVDFGLFCGGIFDGGRVGSSISLGSLVALVGQGWFVLGSNLVMLFFESFRAQQKERESCFDKI